MADISLLDMVQQPRPPAEVSVDHRHRDHEHPTSEMTVANNEELLKQYLPFLHDI